MGEDGDCEELLKYILEMVGALHTRDIDLKTNKGNHDPDDKLGKIFLAGHLSFYRHVQESLFRAMAAFEVHCDFEESTADWLLDVATRDAPPMRKPESGIDFWGGADPTSVGGLLMILSEGASVAA